MLTEEATTMPGFRVTKPMIKVLIMCLFAFVTYGLGGVGVILLMVFFSYLRIGKDDPNKHGISTIRSSRLGGVAVLFVAAMYIFGLWAFSPYTPGVIREPINMYMWISLFFATLLGFCDDIRRDFLSLARPHRGQSRLALSRLLVRLRKNRLLLSLFILQMHHFIKTGSGQT